MLATKGKDGVDPDSEEYSLTGQGLGHWCGTRVSRADAGHDLRLTD